MAFNILHKLSVLQWIIEIVHTFGILDGTYYGKTAGPMQALVTATMEGVAP